MTWPGDPVYNTVRTTPLVSRAWSRCSVAVGVGPQEQLPIWWDQWAAVCCAEQTLGRVLRLGVSLQSDIRREIG